KPSMSHPNLHRAVYYSLLPHPSKRKVLLIEDEQGWTLPYLCADEDHFGVVSHIHNWLTEHLRISATVLYCPYYREDPHTRQVHAVNVLEIHRLPDRLPSGTRWIGPDDLRTLAVAPPEHRILLENWFE